MKTSRSKLTLCIVRENDQLLFGMKKRGFGAGLWNGFGGKVKAGESLHDATLRELKEEAGIQVQILNKRGVINFNFPHSGEMLEVHVFEGRGILGEIGETEEMKPQWFDISEIPFNEMWDDDKYWMPLFLEGKVLKGEFTFNEQNKVAEYSLV